MISPRAHDFQSRANCKVWSCYTVVQIDQPLWLGTCRYALLIKFQVSHMSDQRDGLLSFCTSTQYVPRAMLAKHLPLPAVICKGHSQQPTSQSTAVQHDRVNDRRSLASAVIQTGKRISCLYFPACIIYRIKAFAIHVSASLSCLYVYEACRVLITVLRLDRKKPINIGHPRGAFMERSLL